MKEYIERPALVGKLTSSKVQHAMREMDGSQAYSFFLTLVNKEPAADVVEVVQCKDCKYIRPEVDAHTHEAVGCWCSLLCLGSIEDEHFCSYGERRDDHGTERS